MFIQLVTIDFLNCIGEWKAMATAATRGKGKRGATREAAWWAWGVMKGGARAVAILVGAWRRQRGRAGVGAVVAPVNEVLVGWVGLGNLRDFTEVQGLLIGSCAEGAS
jgi:hypothetical protein